MCWWVGICGSDNQSHLGLEVNSKFLVLEDHSQVTSSLIVQTLVITVNDNVIVLIVDFTKVL